MEAGIQWNGILVAGALTWLLLWLLLPWATRLKLLDHPDNGRKDHAAPTPVIGGIAILVGTLAAAFATLDIGRPLLGFAMAATLLVVVGQLDDRYNLRWWLRILAQALAALIMVYVGGVRVEQLGPAFGIDSFGLGLVSVPFTVFATVGIINAINMIDGADGLSGLLVFVALAMLAAAGLYSGNLAIVQFTLLLAGAVAAFLLYNLRLPWQPKARVFLGNSGSMLLGLAIAWVAFWLTQSPSHPVSPVLALWLVPIPIMDCLVLMLRRLRRGQSPFYADRNHIHHLMMEGGFGPTQAAIALALFSCLCGLLIGQAMRLDIPNPLLLALFFVLCALWYWTTARRARAVRLFRRVYRTRLFGQRRNDRMRQTHRARPEASA